MALPSTQSPTSWCLHTWLWPLGSLLGAHGEELQNARSTRKCPSMSREPLGSSLQLYLRLVAPLGRKKLTQCQRLALCLRPTSSHHADRQTPVEIRVLRPLALCPRRRTAREAGRRLLISSESSRAQTSGSGQVLDFLDSTLDLALRNAHPLGRFESFIAEPKKDRD